jgi:hypothetical protein
MAASYPSSAVAIVVDAIDPLGMLGGLMAAQA